MGRRPWGCRALSSLTRYRQSGVVMARPIGKLHQDDVRRKIQVSQLINVLQDHALSGESEIAPSRMKAIEILLRKSLPDLMAMQLDDGSKEEGQSVADVVKAFHEQRRAGNPDVR